MFHNISNKMSYIQFQNHTIQYDTGQGEAERRALSARDRMILRSGYLLIPLVGLVVHKIHLHVHPIFSHNKQLIIDIL